MHVKFFKEKIVENSGLILKIRSKYLDIKVQKENQDQKNLPYKRRGIKINKN